MQVLSLRQAVPGFPPPRHFLVALGHVSVPLQLTTTGFSWQSESVAHSALQRSQRAPGPRHSASVLHASPGLSLVSEHVAKSGRQVPVEQQVAARPAVQVPGEQVPVPGTAQSSSVVQAAPVFPVVQ